MTSIPPGPLLVPPLLPPAGQVRLAADFNCGGLRSGLARVFCVALQRYGAIFADNGSPWFFTGGSAEGSGCAGTRGGWRGAMQLAGYGVRVGVRVGVR